MDNLDTAIAKLRAAADAAQQAALSVQTYSDQLAAAGHAASGGAIDPFVFRLAIFALAVFVGYYVVWSVTPALHTPLSSARCCPSASPPSTAARSSPASSASSPSPWLRSTFSAGSSSPSGCSPCTRRRAEP